jgi:hypothetical protein
MPPASTSAATGIEPPDKVERRSRIRLLALGAGIATYYIDMRSMSMNVISMLGGLLFQIRESLRDRQHGSPIERELPQGPA